MFDDGVKSHFIMGQAIEICTAFVRDLYGKSKVVLSEDFSVGKDIRLNIIQKSSPINSLEQELFCQCIITARNFS